VIEEKIEDQQNAEKTKESSFIELDEIDGTPKKMSHQDRKKQLKDLKAKKEAEYKAKLKEEKNRQKLENGESVSSSGKKRMVIVLVVFIVLAGAFSALYFLRPGLFHFSSKRVPESINANIDTTAVSDTAVKTSDSTINASVQTNETDQQTQNDTKTTVKEQTVSKSVENQNTEPISSKKSDLNSNCWIISFASVKEEKAASKGAKEVVDKGFIGGYYWIPDKDPNGKALFKIYVGPYRTENQAQEALPKIKELSPSAYVLKIGK